MVNTLRLMMPKMVEEVVAQKNDNILWQDVIQKKIENVKFPFLTISKGKKPPNGFQYVNHHMVFNIKMKDF